MGQKEHPALQLSYTLHLDSLCCKFWNNKNRRNKRRKCSSNSDVGWGEGNKAPAISSGFGDCENSELGNCF